MTKSTRLLKLLHTLRHRKHPATAARLAAELGISPRTLYRDINTLCEQGADIRGEAGIGYRLYGDHSRLPPLMFSQDELEAVIIGIRWAAGYTEPAIAQAAENALTKIRSVLPPHLAHTAANAQFSINPAAQYGEPETYALSQIRQALREHRRLLMDYIDLQGNPSRRQIQPIALGYFPEARLLAAWCEQRQDFRHFRCDRIQSIALGEPSPVPHDLLLHQWQQRENIRAQGGCGETIETK